MAVKTQWYKRYWSVDKPVPVEKVVVRYDHVQNGPGVQGSKIGTLGTGTHIIVDTLEDDGGDIRIISVDKYDPVPVNWTDDEWWIDKTALQDVAPVDGDVQYILTIHADRTVEIRKK